MIFDRASVVNRCKEAPEQIAVGLLLENASECFDHKLLSITGSIVLWGALGTSDELRDRYLTNKGKKELLDHRRRQTVDEELEWIEVDNAARDAWNYLQWAKNDSGQPISRDSLVNYFTAFENCLKSIATAFSVASSNQAEQIDGQFYVAPSILSKARRRIRNQWTSNEYGDSPKGQLFFENEIVGKNPFPSRYVFHSLNQGLWDRIGSVNKERNAIVHSMGLVTEQFDFDGLSLYPGDEIDVTAKALRVIAADFREVLDPFRTKISMRDL